MSVERNREHLQRAAQDQNGPGKPNVPQPAQLSNSVGPLVPPSTIQSISASSFVSLSRVLQVSGQLHEPPQPQAQAHQPTEADYQTNNPSEPSIMNAEATGILPSAVTPPEKLHPTLSCWIKNMDKMSSPIDRLQELASSAPAEYRSQLLRQVVALRTTSKKQRERCKEFLTLSKEYAIKYSLDISVEVQQQMSFLDKIEERLDAANKLHSEVVDLRMFYESGTVASMENLRATGKAASDLSSFPGAEY
jgi:hypothetical protein